MKSNIGISDRAFRLFIGLTILGLGIALNLCCLGGKDGRAGDKQGGQWGKKFIHFGRTINRRLG